MIAAASGGLLDGNFATPSLPPNSTGQPAGSPWVFANTSGFMTNNSPYGNPPSTNGVQAAIMQCGAAPACGTSTGVEPGISQTFSVAAPGTYNVSFDAAHRTVYDTAAAGADLVG